jgi:hypothetical protein
MITDPVPESMRDAKNASTERPSLKKIKCLVPVWGYAYIKKFLEVALPTWLADGNLPAVSRMAPTEIVLLTSRDDEPYLRAHPAFLHLAAVCPITIHFIDHVITGNNYSTTMTLAYTEAVRQTGGAMLDTCFLFLVSDYIVSDGSFTTVVERIQGGRSGVLAGNFQVVEEAAVPWLTELLKTTPAVLTLPPRELLKWALVHLHPVTTANTINFPVVHNEQSNRLFWRVDNQSLIGRFFLMHMIAIRPELQDFVIGSSCDYSFIPEMCPSNNVEILNDSDDYLVIELQPRKHEAQWIKPGKQMVRSLARSIGEWATVRHRENAATTVVYHAGERPASLRATIVEADRFIAEVNAALPKEPKPYRKHPFWTGAIAAFKESSGVPLTGDEWRLALGFPNPDLDRSQKLGRAARFLSFLFFKAPPYVRAWHPRHPDYSLVIKTLTELRLDARSQLLMVADSPTIFTATFADGGDRVVRIRSSQLLKRDEEIYEPLHRRFDVCLIELTEPEFAKAHEILDRIAPMVRDGGTVLVSLINQQINDTKQKFQALIGRSVIQLTPPYASSLAFSFVSSNRLKFRALALMLRLGREARDTPFLGYPAALLLGTPLFIAYALTFWITTVRSNTLPKGYVSSALVRMTIDGNLATDVYRYSSSRQMRNSKLARQGFPTRPSPARNIGTAPAMDYLLTGRGYPVLSSAAEIGQGAETIANEPALGLPATTVAAVHNRDADLDPNRDIRSRPSHAALSQTSGDEDRRPSIRLARYKFVADLLGGRRVVGELGYNDPLGTRLVTQATENLFVYDADPRLIESARQQHSETWPIEAQLHDILETPLPHLHDGLYALGLFDNVSRAEENTCIDNLRASLADDGLLIVGSYLPKSPQVLEDGGLTAKSGAEWKALLRNFFSEILVFSMHGESLQTGVSPTADYFLAVCCQRKRSLFCDSGSP